MDGNPNTGDKRKPNSVLFSLKELRRIEKDRVQEEEDEKARAEQAAVDAQTAAKQAAEQEQQRLAYEEQERIRLEQEAMEQKAREEQLHLQEAEQKARIQAEMEIQKARQEAELTAKALEKKVPWVPIVLVSVMLIGGLGGGVWWYMAKQAAEADAKAAGQIAKAKAEQRKIQKEMEQQEALYNKQLKQSQNKMTGLASKLKEAKSDAEKDLLRKQLRDARDRQAQAASQRAARLRRAKKRAKRVRIGDSSDPIHGL